MISDNFKNEVTTEVETIKEKLMDDIMPLAEQCYQEAQADNKMYLVEKWAEKGTPSLFTLLLFHDGLNDKNTLNTYMLAGIYMAQNTPSE